MSEEKFELDFDIDDSAIDRSTRKLKEYERLIRRISGSSRSVGRGVAGGGGGGSASGATGGGLGELIGTLGGMQLGERLLGSRAKDNRPSIETRQTLPQDRPQQPRQQRAPIIPINRRTEAAQRVTQGGQMVDVGGQPRPARLRVQKQPSANLSAVARRSFIQSQAASFAAVRGRQLGQNFGAGRFDPSRFTRSGVSGLARNRIGGALIGGKLGGALGSIIPGAGNIAGMAIGMMIGASLDRMLQGGMQKGEETKALRKDVQENQIVISEFAKSFTTRDLRDRDLGLEYLRAGGGGFSLFGNLFGGPEDQLGPGWSSHEFRNIRNQQRRELQRRQTGGTSSDMEAQRVEQAIYRLIRE